MDFDAGAGDGFAGEVGFFGFDEVDGAVDGGVDGVVAGLEGAGAGDFGVAGLADEDFAGTHGLAAEAFDAEALTGTVVDVFGGAASFDMTHCVIRKPRFSSFPISMILKTEVNSDFQNNLLLLLC